MNNIEIVRKIEGKKDCQIYEIKYGPKQIRACMKILTCRHESQFNKAIGELTLLLKASNLKMSIKHLGQDTETQNEGNSQVKILKIITEYCSGGNLNQYIIKRKKINNPFEYSELKVLFYDLIEYFTNLQQLGISHRDIKPDNFVLTQNDELKVCDFGSSKAILGEPDSNNTITGSPLFLSPELREGFYKYLNRSSGQYMEYNPFKSDVYSLGLVFLFMIKMDKFDCDPYNFESFKRCVNQNISTLEHEQMKILLNHMLEFECCNRPDFNELFDLYKNIFNKELCFICKQLNDKSQINCQKCEIAFHCSCFEGKLCPNCKAALGNTCQECRQVKLLKCNLHSLCEICGSGKTECFYCVGFEVFESSECEFHFYSSKFNCNECESQITPNSHSREVECSNCAKNWCQLCKRPAHRESCSDDSSNIGLYCPCGDFHSFAFNSIFYECPKLGSLCLVCLKNSNEGHSRCSSVLNQNISSPPLS